MDYRKVYREWLDNDYFDDAAKAELREIAKDEKEIEERFYTELEFGTAGLRGIIGAGTNRMNIYTVRKATQGLANYILKIGTQDMGVAIAYDSRRMSPEFAAEAALCLHGSCPVRQHRYPPGASAGLCRCLGDDPLHSWTGDKGTEDGGSHHAGHPFLARNSWSCPSGSGYDFYLRLDTRQTGVQDHPGGGYPTEPGYQAYLQAGEDLKTYKGRVRLRG